MNTHRGGYEEWVSAQKRIHNGKKGSSSIKFQKSEARPRKDVEAGREAKGGRKKPRVNAGKMSCAGGQNKRGLKNLKSLQRGNKRKGHLTAARGKKITKCE